MTGSALRPSTFPVWLRRWQVVWVWLALAALAGVAACERKGRAAAGDGLPPVLKIGVYMPMTGDTATFGTSSMGGIRLATEQRNAAGGIRGSRIELILEDDRGQPEEAKTVVTRLVTRDNVIAVLGEVGSARSIVAASVCQQKRVPMLTPSSTNEKVTRKGDFIFRVCFIDPFQGEAAAKFAVQDLKLRRAAIITDVKNDYSVGLTKSFRESFTRLGGTVVIEKNYQAGDASFNAQLTGIREAGADFVYAPGYYGDVGQIIKQARELGIRAPFIGGDGWDSPDLWRGGKEALDGCFITNHYSVDNPDPRVQAFIAAYRQRYGDTPMPWRRWLTTARRCSTPPLNGPTAPTAKKSATPWRPPVIFLASPAQFRSTPIGCCQTGGHSRTPGWKLSLSNHHPPFIRPGNRSAKCPWTSSPLKHRSQKRLTPHPAAGLPGGAFWPQP
jgi:branched-chain amino acid transport system substrate-binding protein